MRARWENARGLLLSRVTKHGKMRSTRRMPSTHAPNVHGVENRHRIPATASQSVERAPELFPREVLICNLWLSQQGGNRWRAHV